MAFLCRCRDGRWSTDDERWSIYTMNNINNDSFISVYDGFCHGNEILLYLCMKIVCWLSSHTEFICDKTMNFFRCYPVQQILIETIKIHRFLSISALTVYTLFHSQTVIHHVGIGFIFVLIFAKKPSP